MIKILLVVAAVAAIIVLMPLASIWALNTLFSLTIPMTFDTWCAAVILGGVVSGNSFISFKK